MANTLVSTIRIDGHRNAVVSVVGFVDTSDLSATDIVDPSGFTPTPTTFRVDRITYSIEEGLTVRLWWDANTDVLITTLNGAGVFDYRRFGGIQNNAGAGVSGKIQLSTEGWASSAIDNFSLDLELVKIGV